MESSEQKTSALKKLVLEDQMGFLCEELGDPGRYFPYLRSKRMLDSMDCQSIRSQVTFKDQIQELIGILKSRRTSKGEHAFDVLVDALKKQRVQAHIARALQKALAKAKDETATVNGVETRSRSIPKEEIAIEPSPLCSILTSDISKDGEQYQMHPQHGALPPLPTDQSTAMSNSPVYDEQSDSMHPQHGLLPSQYDSSIYAQQESGLKAESPTCYNSECELGGQSQPRSFVADNFGADKSMSSQFISHDTSTSSYIEREDSVDVLKLEAKIQDLCDQLERAQAENKRKDSQILTLQRLLDGTAISDRNMASQPSRPYQLKMNGSGGQVNALVTPSGTYAQFNGHAYHSSGSVSPRSLHKELGEQPQGWGERKTNPLSTNFTSRSKSSSPSASVSIV